jgi:hypothetical protein
MSRMLNTLSTTSEMTLSNPNCVPLIQNSCTDHKYLMEEPHIPLFYDCIGALQVTPT